MPEREALGDEAGTRSLVTLVRWLDSTHDAPPPHATPHPPHSLRFFARQRAETTQRLTGKNARG
eukprot:6958224-Pyramimonas_sp.AAC.1